MRPPWKLALALSGLLLLAGPAAAQTDYPTRPIRFVIPFPTGGSTDIVARVVADAMAAQLGQTVVSDNRPGASGTLGTKAVADAAPRQREGAPAGGDQPGAVAMPDVPTMIESGVADYELVPWVALSAPAGTPRPVIDRLNRALRSALADPKVAERLLTLGTRTTAGTPEDMDAFIAQDFKTWGELARITGAKPQ